MAEVNRHTPTSGKESFNSSIYRCVISSVVDNDADYFWLANKLASLYRKVNSHGCVDATRASKVLEGGGWSQQYEDTISCCGQSNVKVENPITGNAFWIGFNYGH